MGSKTIKGFAIICLFLCINGCGEHTQTGEAIKKNTQTDSLEKQARDSLFANNTYARNLLRSGMAKATDSLTFYRLMNHYVKACFASSDFDSVLYYNQIIARFCREASDSPSIHDMKANVYNMTGNYWIQKAEPDSSLAYYRKAYEEQRLGNNVFNLPELCFNLADASNHLGNYADGAFYYRRGLFLCDSLQLPDTKKWTVYWGLGQTYMELRDFELSNYYYELAGNYYQEMNPYEKWGYLNNRGNHFYYKKDYLQAEYYISRGLHVLDDYPQMIFERNLSKGNLGELYMLNGKLDSAQIYLNDSYRYFTEMNNRSALYYIETQLIELALNQGDISRAGRLIANATPGVHIDANMINIRNQYLEHYYERTGDYRRAYEYLKRDVALNDSIRNERVRTRVAELDMRYRQDTIVMRRELVIGRQTSEMRVLRLTSFIWAIGCIVLIAALSVFYWLMKKKRAFMQERHLNQISRLRMENIRNHISPHFTFNVLNREISHLKGSEEDREGLVGLAKLLRKSLELTEKLSIPLREELDFVRTYINLEQTSLGSDFILTLSIDDKLNTEQIIIPSMIIQIPVENAMKHGLAGIEGEKRLTISVISEGNGVRIIIVDNGRGYLPHMISPSRGTGTGLKVLYQTIQLLNQKNKGEKICFEIKKLADGQQTGTCVSVYIPYKYSYDL